MEYKSQTIQDVSIRIHSIKDDGTDNTGDAANLSTVILDPAGNELVGTTNYTEATFDEIGTTGVYECLFPSTAPVEAFTSVDQDNPYTVSLISSTADIGASSETIRIVSVYSWDLQDTILTRLASTPFAIEHTAGSVVVTNGTILAGTLTDIQTINQEYLKVEETGKFTIDTTYTGVDEEHDEFFVRYRYFGAGSTNHKVEMKMWNYNTSQWDDVLATDRDLPATDIDITARFDVPTPVANYYTGTIPNLTAQLRIEHESNPNPAHQFWLDAIGLGAIEQVYTPPDNAGITQANESITTGIQKVISIVESQRGHHTATGNVFYMDPVNGSDNFDGTTPEDAKQTYSYQGANGAHSLLTDSNHDLLIILPGSPSGPTEINEYIAIDTRYTFIRGMGRDIFINATHTETEAVLLSAEGAEISAVRINTNISGVQDAIRVSADFGLVDDVWIDYARRHGVIIDNASKCIVDGLEVKVCGQSGTGHAVLIDGSVSTTTENIIQETKAYKNGLGGASDGIRITGANASHNYIIGGGAGIICQDNTGYGINETDSADSNIFIGPRIILSDNDLGQANLIGANSIIQNINPWALETTAQDILDQVTGIGNRVVTIHVEDTLTNSLQDVIVRIGEATVITDVAGDAVFALDDGDYDVILRKEFVSFTVPESLTVAGDGTHDYTGTLVTPSPPTQSGTCVVYGNVIDVGADPTEDVKISINETDDSTFSNTQKIVADKETTSDVNGFWQLEVIRSSELSPVNSSYDVVYENGDGSFRWATTITVPDEDSAEISTIID